jgi:predicted Zn-dependent protease
LLAAAPSLEAQLGLAEGEGVAGRDDVAAREYQRVLQLDPANATALRALARIEARSASTWPRSEAHYRQYVAVQPADAPVQLELGRVLLWQGKAADALEMLARPAVQQLLGFEDRRNYAFALVKAGHAAEGERALEELRATRPADDDIALQLAGLRAGRGDVPGALVMYRSVLEQRPDNARAHLAYGLGLLSVDDHAGALPHLARASQAFPESGEAALGYARALRGTHDLKRAAREFERALRFAPGNAELHRELADLLLEKRDPGKAVTCYRRALSLGLKDQRLLVALASALSSDGKPRDAVPYLEEAYRRQPGNRLAFELAKLYQRAGRNDQALALLRKLETGTAENTQEAKK